jgi:regulator of replication initiation timing
MEDKDHLIVFLKDLKCLQPPSEAQELLNSLHNMVPTEINGGAASSSGLQQRLEAFVRENDMLRVQNLTLVKEIDGSRKENERLRSENAALALELQGT